MTQIESDPSPLSRVELLRLAQSLGVSDADVMTRAELRAAIDKAKRPEPRPAEHPTTWVSVARRLLARVVERGLNLPDAAALIRGDTKLSTPPKAPPPVATVTLARIYAAQGHLDRAIGTLDEVLESDPDHELARELHTQLWQRRDELRAGRAAAEVVAPAVAPEPEPDAGEAPPPGAHLAEAAPAGDAPKEVADLPRPPEPEPSPSVSPELAGASDRPANLSEPAVPPPTDSASAAPDPGAPPLAATEPAPASDPAREEDTPTATGLPKPSAPEPRPSARVAEAPSEAHLRAANPYAANLYAPNGSAERARSLEPPPREDETPTATGLPKPTAPERSTSSVAPSLEEVLGSAPPAQSGPRPLTPLTHADASSVDAPAELVAPAFGVSEPAPHVFEPLSDADQTPTLLSSVQLDADAFEPSAPAPSDEAETPTIAAAVELPTSRPPAAADLQAHPVGNGVSNGITHGDALRVPEAVSPPAAAAPPVAPPPSTHGLVVIETDSPVRFVYWELVTAGSPHWIHVVTHTPNPHGAALRRERRFPVQQQLGALRLEGVPRGAIVRAWLTRGAEADARALVVASAVRPTGGEAFEVRFTPHGRQNPAPIASRARPALDRASPVYWDD
jgi:hypothetical protein